MISARALAAAGCFILLMVAQDVLGQPAHDDLPADVPMNLSAGRGGALIVNLRLNGGEPIEFIVDTGSPITLFEKSLIPKLGRRLGSWELDNFGATQISGLYAAPELWLGNVRLRTGRHVGSFDNRKLANPTDYPTPGILGMDVLSHYCIQLDFSAGKIRFLDGDKVNKRKWGKPYSLFDTGNGCFFVYDNLAGVPPLGSMIDTGFSLDGWLTPPLFAQWTNQVSVIPRGAVHSPKGAFDGNTYTGLMLNQTNSAFIEHSRMGAGINGIGLRFLARHLVTLDFPNETLYLDRTSRGPLSIRHLRAEAIVAGHDALDFMWELQRRDRLPGWWDGENPAEYYEHFTYEYLNCELVTFDRVRKPGDPSVYHYEFMRLVPQAPWTLFKAWRADQNGRTVEEYPSP